mmetsp:Transcript_12645/g.28290  ORF Transcript_12645/g.28290 Transcript_12645/m.28290 type:complete len:213 (-) Transcript_12645:568-1206(-)
MGPALAFARHPSATTGSSPVLPSPHSSSEMKTAITLRLSVGADSASCAMNLVTRATWPRQSVVPRPRISSPSLVNSNGLKSHSFGSAGTTSMCMPTSATVLSPVPGYVTTMLGRPETYSLISIFRGPPSSVDSGRSTSKTWRATSSSFGHRPWLGLFCTCWLSPRTFPSNSKNCSSLHWSSTAMLKTCSNLQNNRVQNKMPPGIVGRRTHNL